MASPVFAPKDFKAELLTNFFQGIANREDKIQIIKNWQKAILNGTVERKKEEQLKSEFLDKFFGQVLGYSYESHEQEWNLEKEFKSITDGKRPDAALGYFDNSGKQNVRCVIEVKGGLANLDKKQNRADFQGSAVDQAFSYVPRMPGKCDWVIVTNMIEIRLYSRSDIGRYESFTIPDLLLLDNLQRFFFLLSFNQLFLETADSRIDQLYLNRQAEQKKIGAEFYWTYKDVRNRLFYNLQRENKTAKPKDLFRLTQKLIDRLVFIGFVRDLRLVDNVLTELSQNIKTSFRKDNQKAWGELKELFNALNEGYSERNIPPFNGELFKPDTQLDALTVRDHQLMELIKLVQDYDFHSQLDVNILGHIFEQSVADLPEIQQFIQQSTPLEVPELKPEATGTTKRKKEGIFYTPDYITRYMVQQAVGGWLDDRKKEILTTLKVSELPEPEFDDYATIKLVNNEVQANETILLNLRFWREYEKKLSTIKVLDPACGSGAFLNQVFDFLYDQWAKEVNPEVKKLTTPPDKQKLQNGRVSEPLGFTYGADEEWHLKKSIILNNIYGVDLNAESVEITKLSLWLKTANKTNSLAALYDNIKQGNSLIDDPKVAGDDAFNWKKAFPEIMKAGGFDVVVGNPPYSYRNAIEESEKDFFKKNYDSCEGNYDLYKFFIEKLASLSSVKGLSCFIVPNTFLSAITYKKLREVIIKEFDIKEIYDLGLNVFDDVVVESIVFLFVKGRTGQTTKIKIQRAREVSILTPEKSYTLDIKNAEEFNIYLSKENKAIVQKIENDSVDLGKICYCTVGINTGYIKEELVSNKKVDKRYHKVLNGKDIGRYSVSWPGDWIMYDASFVKGKGELGRSLPPERIFTQEKILIQRTRRGLKRKLVCYFDPDGYYNLNRLSNVVIEDSSYSLKYIYVLLNSELLDFYFNKVFIEYEVKPVHLAKIPIKKINKKQQQPFITMAEKMIELSKDGSGRVTKFLELLQANYTFQATSKLKKWHELEFVEIIAELEKAGAKIPPKKQGEWLELFKTEKATIKNTQAEIEKTDKEIDRLVYQLYGLTEEEIAVVEKV